MADGPARVGSVGRGMSMPIARLVARYPTEQNTAPWSVEDNHTALPTAAVIVPQVITKVDEARVAKAKQDIQSLETALTMFRLDNSKYPTTEQGLAALTTQPTDPTIRHWRPGGYLQHVSKDPWGNDYQYTSPGTHVKDYDLYTLGADGQPGGEGQDADIGNWNMTD